MRGHVELHKEGDKKDVLPIGAKQSGNCKAASKKTKVMVSWSAYHGRGQSHVNTRCQSSLLPLFEECAHLPAMIKHAITIVIKAIEHLSLGQAAVIAFDQPLYALAKEIQGRYPDTMGEDKLVVMLGGLHIELAALKAIISWLLGSGWTDAVAQAGITTPGRAASLVTSAHITRTRYIKSRHPRSISSNRALTGSTMQNLQKSLLHTPIANMATIAPKRGYSVATIAKGRSRLFTNENFPSIRVS